jgi:Fe-S-cluster containining protein
MGSVCCEHCTAACCRYLALPLDEPESARDFDDIRWYLMHAGVAVFVEDGDWYVQVQTDCSNLLPDNRCGVYETRPKICREYKAEDCDYSCGGYTYDLLLQCPEDLEQYLERKRAKKNGRRAKRKKTTRGKRTAARS